MQRRHIPCYRSDASNAFSIVLRRSPSYWAPGARRERPPTPAPTPALSMVARDEPSFPRHPPDRCTDVRSPIRPGGQRLRSRTGPVPFVPKTRTRRVQSQQAQERGGGGYRFGNSSLIACATYVGRRSRTRKRERDWLCRRQRLSRPSHEEDRVREASATSDDFVAHPVLGRRISLLSA